MSLANFDANKLRNELSKPPKKNEQMAVKQLGIRENKFTNKNVLGKLRRQAFTLMIIEKKMLEKNPELGNVEFLGEDPGGCVKEVLKAYLGDDAKLTRGNIKEALKNSMRNIEDNLSNDLNQKIEKIINNGLVNKNMNKPFDPKNFDKLDRKTIFNMINAYKRGNMAFENVYNAQKNILKSDKQKLEQLNLMYSKIKRGNNIKNFIDVSKLTKNNIDLEMLIKFIAPKVNNTDVYKIYSSRNNNTQYNQIKKQLEGKYSKGKKNIEKIDYYIQKVKEISKEVPDFEKMLYSGNIRRLIITRVLEDIKTFKILIKQLIKYNRPKYNPDKKCLINYEGFENLLKIYNILYPTNRNKNNKIYKLLNIKSFIEEASKKYKLTPAVLNILADGALYLDENKLNKSYKFVVNEFEDFLNKKFTKFSTTELKGCLDKFIVFENGDKFSNSFKKYENIEGGKNKASSKKAANKITKIIISEFKPEFLKRLKSVTNEFDSLIFK